VKTKSRIHVQTARSGDDRQTRRDDESVKSELSPAFDPTTPAGILALQRTVGNAAVNRLLAAQTAEGSTSGQGRQTEQSPRTATDAPIQDHGSEHQAIQRLMTYAQFKTYSSKWYFGGRKKVLPIDALIRRYHAEPENRRAILSALKSSLQEYAGKRTIARLERQVDEELAALPPLGGAATTALPTATESVPIPTPVSGTTSVPHHGDSGSDSTPTPVESTTAPVIPEAVDSALTTTPIGDTTTPVVPETTSTVPTTAPVIPPKPYLDGTAAQQALTEAFGDIRTIDAGKVDVLKQAEFQVAYDAIYGTSIYSWDAYIKPGPGNLEGFAHNNINYINEDCISYDTVPHEMLHNNTAGDWRDVVGNEFDEGTTEHLTIAAMDKLGKTPTHSYPDQHDCVKAVVAAGVSEESLKTAYLKGGGQTLVADVITANCQHSWSEFKDAMQAKDFVLAKTLLVRK
jgi:hypothetical protein